MTKLSTEFGGPRLYIGEDLLLLFGRCTDLISVHCCGAVNNGGVLSTRGRNSRIVGFLGSRKL